MYPFQHFHSKIKHGTLIKFYNEIFICFDFPSEIENLISVSLQQEEVFRVRKAISIKFNGYRILSFYDGQFEIGCYKILK